MNKTTQKLTPAIILFATFIIFSHYSIAAESERSINSSSATIKGSSLIVALNNTQNKATQTINSSTIPIITAIAGSPVIISQSPTAITKNSATLNGSINPKGSPTEIWFEIQNTGSTLTQNIGNGTSVVSATHNMTGLIPSTTYSFRVVASNLIGTTYGSWTTFTTLANSVSGGGGGSGYITVSVTTQNASNILSSSATLNGTITHSNTTTTTWFRYGTSSNLGIYNETAHIYPGWNSGLMPIAQNITGLAPNTTYYFRIIEISNSNTQVGNILSFTTTNPVVINSNPNIIHNDVIDETDEGDKSNLIVNQMIDNNNNDDVNQKETFGKNLTSSAIFSYVNFLPSTIFGWVILIILVLCIIIVSRRLYVNIQKEKDKDLTADHIDNLPT